MRPKISPFSRRTLGAVVGLALLAGCLGFVRAAHTANPNALWQIVHGECVPNEEQHGDPRPCVEVDLKDGVDRGYAVLKDIKGATQFLLIPTKRVTGIESPDLLAPDSPNYFADAWAARGHVAKALGRPIPDDDLSLAVNSEWGRSQNQLHIHIDCIRADVRRVLRAERAAIGEHWATLKQPLGGHHYLAMRVAGAALDGHDPFKLLADGVPNARAEMAKRTLIVVPMFEDQRASFVILSDRADLLHGDFASGALLQDHTCALVQ
jgi:CDP-diacylglycerol pyrophosphatase